MRRITHKRRASAAVSKALLTALTRAGVPPPRKIFPARLRRENVLARPTAASPFFLFAAYAKDEILFFSLAPSKASANITKAIADPTA